MTCPHSVRKGDSVCGLRRCRRKANLVRGEGEPRDAGYDRSLAQIDKGTVWGISQRQVLARFDLDTSFGWRLNVVES